MTESSRIEYKRELSDSLAITSSGGLPYGVALDDFFGGYSSPRNNEKSVKDRFL
ncbi:MAG: hypothetical protein M0T82_13265 [Desulfobacteraceae bacterium]|nr:hypothetical protein [Desulfobacteraceae bacterium]